MSDTCPHGIDKLAELYPSLQPHWRPYRYALDTNASPEEKERLRQAAWKAEGDQSVDETYERVCKQLAEAGISKGSKGGECNRTGCASLGANWYNQYTQRWYCEACARRINQAATHAICDRR